MPYEHQSPTLARGLLKSRNLKMFRAENSPSGHTRGFPRPWVRGPCSGRRSSRYDGYRSCARCSGPWRRPETGQSAVPAPWQPGSVCGQQHRVSLGDRSTGLGQADQTGAQHMVSLTGEEKSTGSVWLDSRAFHFSPNNLFQVLGANSMPWDMNNKTIPFSPIKTVFSWIKF